MALPHLSQETSALKRGRVGSRDGPGSRGEGELAPRCEYERAVPAAYGKEVIHPAPPPATPSELALPSTSWDAGELSLYLDWATQWGRLGAGEPALRP